MTWVYYVIGLIVFAQASWLFGLWVLNRLLVISFKDLFESAKQVSLEEFLQNWEAAGIKFWTDANLK